MNKRILIDIDDKQSFILGKNNIPEVVVFKKNTTATTSLIGDKYTVDKKRDLIIAAIKIRDGKTVYHSVVYEPVLMKEIEQAFRQFVMINNLDVLDSVTLKADYSRSPRSVLGNGGFKSAQIFDSEYYR